MIMKSFKLVDLFFTKYEIWKDEVSKSDVIFSCESLDVN